MTLDRRVIIPSIRHLSNRIKLIVLLLRMKETEITSIASVCLEQSID